MLRLHFELIFCALTPGHCYKLSSLTHRKYNAADCTSLLISIQRFITRSHWGKFQRDLRNLIQCLTSNGHLPHLQQFSFYTQIYTRPVKCFPFNSFYTNAPKLSTPTLGRQALHITHLSSLCPLPILNINYQYSNLYSRYNTPFLLTNSV